MKRIRYYLAVIALAATLAGPSLFGVGAAAIAYTAASRPTSSVSSHFVVGTSTRSVAFRSYDPCPLPGWDC